MTNTEVHAHSHFAAGYDHDQWNDKLAKELNITKYGFNDYLNTGKYEKLITHVNPDLEWKKELRQIFEQGKAADEQLEADTAKAEEMQEKFNQHLKDEASARHAQADGADYDVEGDIDKLTANDPKTFVQYDLAMGPVQLHEYELAAKDASTYTQSLADDNALVQQRYDLSMGSDQLHEYELAAKNADTYTQSLSDDGALVQQRYDLSMGSDQLHEYELAAKDSETYTQSLADDNALVSTWEPHNQAYYDMLYEVKPSVPASSKHL
jgi:hypothetical protein